MLTFEKQKLVKWHEIYVQLCFAIYSDGILYEYIFKRDVCEKDRVVNLGGFALRGSHQIQNGHGMLKSTVVSVPVSQFDENVFKEHRVRSAAKLSAAMRLSHRSITTKNKPASESSLKAWNPQGYEDSMECHQPSGLSLTCNFSAASLTPYARSWVGGYLISGKGCNSYSLTIRKELTWILLLTRSFRSSY